MQLFLRGRVLVQTNDGRHSHEINLFFAREARVHTRNSVPVVELCDSVIVVQRWFRGAQWSEDSVSGTGSTEKREARAAGQLRSRARVRSRSMADAS